MSSTTKFERADDGDMISDSFTSNDESDELFSDDEQRRDINHKSDISQDTSILFRSETPLLSIDNSNSITLGDAVIPSTPLSLMPFLNKTNEQWTSDLETPQADKSAQPHMRLSMSTTKNIEKTPELERHTPDISFVKSIDKVISDSPVIVSRTERKRPKRRVFKTFISLDTLAETTNNKHIAVNMQIETALVSTSTNNFVAPNDANVAMTMLHSANTNSEDNRSRFLNGIRDIHDNSNVQRLQNFTPDALGSLSQEFFSNVSFSSMDKLCCNNLDEEEIIYTAVQSRQGIESMNKERNAPQVVDLNETSRNAGFLTARGTVINVSKEALFKAKTLLTDEMQMQNYKSSGKSSIEQNNLQPSSSAVNNLFNITLSESKLQLAEESKDYNERQTENCKKPFCNENSTKNIDMLPLFFSTAGGAPIRISKEALSTANTLLADELHRDDDTMPVRLHQRLSVDRRAVKKKNMAVECSASGKPINISEKSLAKTVILFAEHLDVPDEEVGSNKIDICDDELHVKISNVEFQTARGMSIDTSEEALSKAKLLFAKELDKPLESNIDGETVGDIKVKTEEARSPNFGFQTARGASIQISTQALSKAKLLFAEQLNYSSETDTKVNADNKDAKGRDGFKSTRNRHVTVSSDAIPKARVLLFNECPDRHSNLDMELPSRVSLQKRKLRSDAATLLNRTSGSKKARRGDEFEGRQLFVAGGDKKIQSKNLSSRMSMDDECNEKRMEATTESLSVVQTNSVECPDEKTRVDSVVDCILHSPTRDALEETEANVTGSPVIGRQPISRRRMYRSLEQRRSKHASPSNAVERQIPGAVDATSDRICKEESQRSAQIEKSKVESSESTEYGDTQMMMDFIDESASILQDRLVAALEQEKMITAKRRCGSEQLTGYLFRRKQTNARARLTLRDASNGASPIPRSYQELIDQRMPPNILAITAASAASYKFRCSDFYGNEVARNNVHGIEMEDGARLIMDENGYAGVWEFLRAFLASPGVDPNLVPARWIENHYRWIVWKLASMDRMKFGSAELPRALTPSQVMAQLKYRYDREIDRSQRPAIRRILEKDDVASKRMILCVSSIAEDNSNVATSVADTGGKKSSCVLRRVPKWRMELTDGWYSIPTCIDMGMVRHVLSGKVREGTKLLIFGAELFNCEEGYYPLEAPAEVYLKLHTNSTRRARWDARLGYTPHSAPIPIRLRDVCPSGGLIGKMTVMIARVYPMLYHEKTASGESVVRNAKCEEKVQIEYERRCRSKAEAFCHEAEKDFQDDLSRETDLLVGGAGEKKQHELLRQLYMKKERYQQKLQLQLRESLPAPRQISPLLRVRVCDGDANAILSTWSPSEEVVDDFKEGACVSLCNIVASGKRGCELQLTARHSAICHSRTMRDTSYPARVYTSFREVDNSEFSLPYGEFDTVGFVCFVGPAPYGLKDFEVTHLAYPNFDTGRSLYLSVLFWQGIASYGYAEILTVGSIVACKNLEWRRATSWNIPVAYCTDRSIFTGNPRQNYLHEPLETLRSLIVDSTAYVDKCVFELDVELQKKSMMKTPTRYALDKYIPNRVCNFAQDCTDNSVNCTSLLSTPKLSAASGGRFIATSSSIQKRLGKLQWYSDPPELSPIVIRSSKKVSSDFRSPTSKENLTKDTSSTDISEHSEA